MEVEYIHIYHMVQFGRNVLNILYFQIRFLLEYDSYEQNQALSKN